jgi:hypothetical protein
LFYPSDSCYLFLETLSELVLGLLGCYLIRGLKMSPELEKLITSFVPAYKVIQLLCHLSNSIVAQSSLNSSSISSGTKERNANFDALIRVGLNGCLRENRYFCLDMYLKRGGCLLDFVGYYFSLDYSDEIPEEKRKLILAKYEDAMAERNQIRERELERMNRYQTLALSIAEKSLDSTIVLATFCSFVYCIIERDGGEENFVVLLRQTLLALVEISTFNLLDTSDSSYTVGISPAQIRGSPLILALCQKPLALKCRSSAMLESILSPFWDLRFG